MFMSAYCTALLTQNEGIGESFYINWQNKPTTKLKYENKQD